MRFEANVSVRPAGSQSLGPRHEVKNLNSFRALSASVAYEIKHQVALLESGGAIQQQTMGWDENLGVTVPQRGKEFAHDYRYFPEPDIPPLEIGRETVEAMREKLPELPREKHWRFVKAYGLSEYDAALLTDERNVARYYERVVSAGAPPKQAANWITGEIFRLMKTEGQTIEQMSLNPADLAALIALVERGTINQSTARDVFGEMVATGCNPRTIVREEGLGQISDAGELREIVTHVLDRHPDQVEEYLGGKDQLVGWFIGRVMRATGGKANPQLARELLQEELEARRG